MGCDSGLLGVQSPNHLHSPDQTEFILQAHAACITGNVYSYCTQVLVYMIHGLQICMGLLFTAEIKYMSVTVSRYNS